MIQKFYRTFTVVMVLNSVSLCALGDERPAPLSRTCATLGYAVVCSSMYAYTSLQSLYQGDADNRAALAGLVVSGVILVRSSALLKREIEALYEKERRFFQML